jgi:hypothetical protein
MLGNRLPLAVAWARTISLVNSLIGIDHQQLHSEVHTPEDRGRQNNILNDRN